MEFGLTADQKMMQESVDRTLERVMPLDARAQGGGDFAPMCRCAARTRRAGHPDPGRIRRARPHAARCGAGGGNARPSCRAGTRSWERRDGAGRARRHALAQKKWLPSCSGEIDGRRRGQRARVGAREKARHHGEEREAHRHVAVRDRCRRAQTSSSWPTSSAICICRCEAKGVTVTALTTIDATRSIGELELRQCRGREPLRRSVRSSA